MPDPIPSQAGPAGGADAAGCGTGVAGGAGTAAVGPGVITPRRSVGWPREGPSGGRAIVRREARTVERGVMRRCRAPWRQ